MCLRTVVSLVALFVVCFTVAVWSQPPTTQPEHVNLGPAATNPSVAGKISAIGDASFCIDVKKGAEIQTLQFAIDENTKVVGKPEVGAQATVEYRADGGHNVAVNVLVQQASASQLF